MQILIAPLEDIVLGEKTFFSADEAIGQTVISVENNQGLAANDYVILGIIGNEMAELLKIDSVNVNGKEITLSSATLHEHLRGAVIQKIRYNQRKFYRSTSESGTFTHLSTEGSPVDIEVDNPEGTEFEDSTGSSTSWYKATYFNSTTSNESSTDDAVAVQAGDAEHYTSIFKIKEEAGFKNNTHIGIEIVDRYRTEAEAQADGAVVGKYQLPFSSQPKIFQQIVTLLSAGLLLSKEYGMEADVEISKTGQRKIERAEDLLQKIRDDKLLLIGEDGTELSKRTDVMASSSNVFDADVADKGEMFNLGDEHFKLTDPTDALADSRRKTTTATGFK